MVYHERPIKVTRSETRDSVNLKFEGTDNRGKGQIMYAFDCKKDGHMTYGFGALRVIEGSPFYHLSDEEIAKYLKK